MIYFPPFKHCLQLLLKNLKLSGEKNTIRYIFISFLATPPGLQHLSSKTRDLTGAPSVEALTIGLLGNSLGHIFNLGYFTGCFKICVVLFNSRGDSIKKTDLVLYFIWVMVQVNDNWHSILLSVKCVYLIINTGFRKWNYSLRTRAGGKIILEDLELQVDLRR